MAKVVLHDLHILLDAASRNQLASIAASSGGTSGVGRTIRWIIRKYYTLYQQQLAAGHTGHALYLVEVDGTGRELARERLDLMI